MRRITIAAIVSMIMVACRQEAPPRFPAGQLVDLSHAYDANAIFWPTADPFRLDKVADGVTTRRLLLCREQLLHLRARRHAHRRAGPLRAGAPDRRPDSARSSRGRGGRCRRDEGGRADADYQVSVADFRRAEQGGAIPAGAIVLIRTGFSTRWPDAVALPRHGRTRRGGGRSAPLSRSSPGGGEVADRRTPHQGDRHRHRQHRPRAVDAVRIAPPALRARHSRLRESDVARAASGAGRLHRRAADEDPRRQRSPVARNRRRPIEVGE